MRRLAILFLCLAGLIHCISCIQNPHPQFDAPVMDYIHLPNIHEDFIFADQAKWKQEFSLAIERFQHLLDLEWTEEEHCYLLNQLSYCYLQVGQEEEAAVLLQQLDNTPCLDFSPIKADYLLNKSKYLLAIDSGAQAIPLLHEADQLYQQQYGKLHLRRLQSLTAKAQAYWNYSLEAERAEPYIDEALSMLKEHPVYRPFGARTYLSKADIVCERRSYLDGLSYTNLALTYALKTPYFDTSFVGDCRTLKGHVLKKLDRIEDARIELQEAIRLGELKSGDKERLKNFYEGLLTTYLTKADSISFFHYLDKLKNQFDQFPNAFQNPRCLLAYYYYKTGRYQESEILYTSLEKEYQSKRASNKDFYGETYYVLGDIHRILGHFEKAIHYTHQLIALKFGDDYIPDKLEEENWKQFDELKPSLKPILLIYYSKIPNILYSQYQRDTTKKSQLLKAVAWYSAIDQRFFGHSEAIDENSLLTFANEHFQTTYSKAIRACYLAYQLNPNPEYLQLAHRLLERTKYTLLFRDMLKGKTVFSSDAPVDLIEEEQRIHTALNELRQQKIQDPRHLDVEKEYATIQLLEEQRKLYEQLKTEHKNYFLKRIQQDVASLPKVQQLLGQEQDVAIQYHLSDSWLSIFVLQSDTILLKQIARPSELELWLKRYQRLLYDPELAYRPATYPLFCRTSYQLYQLFMTPIEDIIAGKPRLIICPDVNTQLFPFASLLRHPVEDDSTDYRKLPYLVNNFELSYVYSMKNYWYKQQTKQTLSKSPAILAYAFTEQRRQSPIAGLFRGEALEEIEGTALELDAIRSIYPEGQQHRFRYGKESTRADFLGQVNQGYDIIHLALHANSDTRDRYNCRIHFKSASAPDKAESLYGYELEQLDIETPLVVLSACQTATGEVLEAEGTFSLARSFIVAGAKQVVSSLWEIDDLATQRLMAAFYQQLAKQNTVTQSLHQAQQNYLKAADAYTAYPGYWGGFVVLE